MKYPKNRKSWSSEAIKRAAAKRKETLLSRRSIVFCAACKKEMRFKPSAESRHKYCSPECRRSVSNLKDRPCPICGILQVKRPSDKQNCLSCARIKQGQSMREKGHSPYRYETEESRKKRLQKLSSDENKSRVSLLHKGKDKHTPQTKRFSPYHSAAAIGVFVCPNNTKYPYQNISRFVSENQNLFLPEDVVQKVHGGKPRKSYVCNATQGLSTLHRGSRNTWKGWRLFSDFEITENKGRDMLGATGLKETPALHKN